MASTHPGLENIDLNNSYILGVIYDDESLTLEVDFKLEEGHASYVAPEEGSEGCFKPGFIRFAELDDLRLKKRKLAEGEDDDLSVIHSAEVTDDFAYIDSGWGEIELTASSIRIAFD